MKANTAAGRVLVYGLGRSGRAVCRLLKAQGYAPEDVWVYDQQQVHMYQAQNSSGLANISTNNISTKKVKKSETVAPTVAPVESSLASSTSPPSSTSQSLISQSSISHTYGFPYLPTASVVEVLHHDCNADLHPDDNNHPDASDYPGDSDGDGGNDIAICIAAPGVPWDHPDLQALRNANIEVIGEVEWVYRTVRLPQRPFMVGITATAGKTTTTHWMTALLKAAGCQAYAGANTGKALCDVVCDVVDAGVLVHNSIGLEDACSQLMDDKPIDDKLLNNQPADDGTIVESSTCTTLATRTTLADIKEQPVFVVELSSFQLERCPTFRPNIAVVLNLGIDHLDRHHTQVQYHEAKHHILRNLKASDVFIYNAEDTNLQRWATATAAQTLGYLPTQVLSQNQMVAQDNDEHAAHPAHNKPAYYKDDTLMLAGTPLLQKRDLAICGHHQHGNALAVALLGLTLGVARATIRDSLVSFHGVAGRYATLATLALSEGRYIDIVEDSIATRTMAVEAALASATAPVVWLVGGQDKGADLTPLQPLVQKKVTLLIALGSAKDTFGDAFAAATKVVVRKSTRNAPHEGRAALHEACHWAYEHLNATLQPNQRGTLLLAPLAASFDQFKDYQDRAQAFAEAVAELQHTLHRHAQKMHRAQGEGTQNEKYQDEKYQGEKYQGEEPCYIHSQPVTTASSQFAGHKFNRQPAVARDRKGKEGPWIHS